MTDTDRLAALLRRIDYMNWTAAEVAEKLAAAGVTLLQPDTASRISMEAQRGTRAVFIGEGVFERYAARTAEGWPITIAWGEPDGDGFYSPVFTEHPQPDTALRDVVEADQP